MAIYRFTEKPRNKNSNEPQTFDISDTNNPLRFVGSLTKTKKNWTLLWCSTKSVHPSKASVRLHLRVLGHTVEGI